MPSTDKQRLPLKLAGGLWAFFALTAYCVVWIEYVPSARWLSLKLYEGAWIPFAHLVALLILLFAVDRLVSSISRRPVLLLSFFGVSFFTLVIIAEDLTTAGAIALCAAWIYISGLSVKTIVSFLFKKDIPYHAAAALALVILEGVLFAAGNMGMASYGLKFALLITFPLPAIAAIFVPSRREKIISTKFLEEFSTAGWVFAEGIFLVFCFGYIHAYSPETLVDATALHIPKAASIAGSENINVITSFPYNAFTLMSPYVHEIFSFFYTFAGEQGIKSLTWATIAIMAGAIISLCRSMKTPASISVAAAAGFLLTPAYIWHFGSGYLDMIAAVMGLSGAALLLSELEEDRINNFNVFIAGALFGAAVSAKLIYIVYLAAFYIAAVVVIAYVRKEGKASPLIRFTGAIAAGTAFVSAPHLIFEYVVTGNPVYPAVNWLFESPYWNSKLSAGAIQSFASFGLKEWLMFPYILATRTSLAGSAVEYSDGAGGAWLLVFFPLILVAVSKARKDMTVMAAATGAFLYIAFLAAMGTVYIRYYMPVMPILFCLMAKGAFLLIPMHAKTSGMKKMVFPALLVGLSIPQLVFPTVWSPTLSHWSYYLHGNRIDWLDKHYPGFKGFHHYVNGLPEEARVFVFHSDFVSHIPRSSVFFRPADILFSGLLAKDLPEESLTELNADFWGFLKRFKAGQAVAGFDYQKLDKIIEEHGDIILFNRLDMIDFMKGSRLIDVERLVHTSAREPGPHIRFIVVYAINDNMAPIGKGNRLRLLPIGSHDRGKLGGGWAFMSADGRVAAPDDDNDIRATHDRFFYRKVEIIKGAARLKIALNLKYDEKPDYSAGVQINWMRRDGSLIKSVPFGLFYSESRAAVYAVEDIPPGAKKLAVIIRPSKGKRIVVKSCDLFFESTEPFHR